MNGTSWVDAANNDHSDSSDGGFETWFYGSRSRPSKVSVLRFKGLGLAQDYSIETARPEGGKMKIESWKKHSDELMWKWCFSCRKIFNNKKIGSRSRSRSRTVSDLKDLGLGRGGLIIIRDQAQSRMMRPRLHHCQIGEWHFEQVNPSAIVPY